MKKAIKLFLALLCVAFTTTVDAQVPQKAEDISPLLVGELIPSAKLVDIDGEQVVLNEVTKTKPSVLVFYRGGWCPFCNAQLSGLAKIEDEIVNLGFQILAISPDDYRNLQSTEEQNSNKYTLLSDPNGEFIQQIGIAFETPTMIKGYVATKGQKGKVSDVIPAPAVLIVDEEGKILFEYINPNFKERLSENMLLAVLKELKK